MFLCNCGQKSLKSPFVSTFSQQNPEYVWGAENSNPRPNSLRGWGQDFRYKLKKIRVFSVEEAGCQVVLTAVDC